MRRIWTRLLSRSTSQKARRTTPRLRAVLERLESREVPAAFTPGDLTVFRAGDGTATLANTGNKVFIDEYKTDGTFVQSIELPSTGADKLVINGSSTASGFMQLSGDGKYLSVTGFNSTIPAGSSLSASTSSAVNRSVYIIDASGDLNNAKYGAFNNYASGADPRSAVTNDGSHVYLTTNAGGIVYANYTDTAVTPIATSPTTNLRNVQIFGGQLYVTSGTTTSGGARVAAVGTGVPTTSGQTEVNLPGLTWDYGSNTSDSPYGMFFADLSATVPGIDTMYYADDGVGGTFPGLHKATKDINGNWHFNGAPIVGVSSIRGLTGSVDGSTGAVSLFMTNGSSIDAFVDSSGYDGTPSGSITSLVSAGTNEAFRGITFAPNNVQPNVVSVTAPVNNTTASSITFTVTFNTLVTGLTASNLSLTTTGDLTGAIGTPTTTDGGLDWSVPVTGLVDDGTVRLDVANTALLNPTPGSVPFTAGTVVTVDHTQANGYLDVISGGVAIYRSGAGKSNNVTLDASGTSVTINDTVETIALTQAAKDAGWTGDGSNTITGPSATTTQLKVKLGAGVDTFTLNDENVPVVVTGGGDAGDTLNLPVTVNYAGSGSFTGFDAMNVGPGAILGISTLTLGATAVGTAGSPVVTNSQSVTANGGSGGIDITSTGSSSFTFNEAGADVDISTLAGMLTIAGTSVWDSGNVNLSSPDGVTISGAMGNASTTGGVYIQANTDGNGADGFTETTTGNIITSVSGSINITVNTPSGGTGDAVLGVGSTSSTGSVSVASNAGNILWNPGFIIPALSTTNTSILASGNFTLTTSGAASAIGSSASPLQLNAQAATNVTAATAGTGGVYITRYGTGFTGFTGSAQGAGNIQIWSGAGSNDNIEIVSPGITTGSGSISLRSDDYLNIDGPVGGPGFSGTVFLEANLDGGSSQLLQMSQSNAIVTSNNSATAVVMNAYSVSASGFPVGGIIVGNITVGDGGTVAINADAQLGNSTDATRAGTILQIASTSINTGSGSVIMTAKDNPIGTATNPMNVTAANVSAATNSVATSVLATQPAGDIYIVDTEAGNFSAVTNTAGTNVATVNITTLAGDLTMAGNIKTDDGGINLFSAGNINQTGGVLTTTGLVTLTYTGNAHFTTAGNTAGILSLTAGQSLQVDGTLTVATPISIDTLLSGSGTVSDVNVVSGAVAPGDSPGILTTGNIAFASGSNFNVELNGGTPGVGGYDQLKVFGNVDLGGATLNPTLGYTPGPGQVLTIIDNEGTNAISNMFDGYTEGSTVTVGAVNFTISYIGGDGNDVTLTAPGVAAPAAKVSGPVIINGGAAQRSRVTTLEVDFDQHVTFTGGLNSAFQLSRVDSPGTTVTFDTTNSVIDDSGSGTKVTLKFDITGASVDGVAGNASLSDGRYILTAESSNIGNANGALDGDGNGTAGGDFVTTSTPYLAGPPPVAPTGIYRLYGDADGNGIVDAADFLTFRLGFLNTTQLEFDFNGDGMVDANDFLAFRLNFLHDVV